MIETTGSSTPSSLGQLDQHRNEQNRANAALFDPIKKSPELAPSQQADSTSTVANNTVNDPFANIGKYDDMLFFLVSLQYIW